MELSIVTGTYNRLQYLQRMVQSLRHSVQSLDYEIIIVDGGSNDGTQYWCKAQDDIKLIEQFELVGAIKAFNAGCKQAQGDYVIIANDDIEFLNYSVLAAYSYMQEHNEVGIGAFKQDRGNKSMHVEYMPAILDGRYTNVVYGQVCIVQRWLGDLVGWWGDTGAKTYGGDNELSCNVWQTGYKVAELPCSCIHDLKVVDSLRVKNNRDISDSKIWQDKWFKNGKPLLEVKQVHDLQINVDRQLRIIYAPVYERGNKLQRKTKHTMRDALKARGIVYEFDNEYTSVNDLYDIAYTFQPDVFILQIQNIHSMFTYDIVRNLQKYSKQSKFVLWNGDYHYEDLMNVRYRRLLRLFDVVGLVVDIDIPGINSIYVQAGFEDYDNADDINDNVYDVVYLANGYSDKRLAQADVLTSLDIKLGLFGKWPYRYHANKSTLYDFERNYAIYNSAKFAVSDQQWPQARGYVSDRLFHALRSNACVLQQWFEGMEELMGLKDGVNCYVWKTTEDLKELINWVMNLDDTMINNVVKAGKELVLKNFQYANMVDILLKAANV